MKNSNILDRERLNITQILLNSIFTLYSIACVVPLLLVVFGSLTDEDSIYKNGYSLIPNKFSLASYMYVLSDSKQILTSYTITIAVTVAGTVAGLLITSMYAYVISQKSFKYRGVFTFLVFFTMIFNGGLAPWYLVWVKGFGLKNTFWILIIPYLMNAFYVLMLKSFYQTNAPQAVIDSAQIDGANHFRIFFSIVVHLLTPGLAAVALFLSLQYWNDWYLGLVFITEKKLTPLQYLLIQVQNSIDFLNTNPNAAIYRGQVVTHLPNDTAKMAMAIIGIGPIIIVYPFLQKYYVKGLTIGAIKG